MSFSRRMLAWQSPSGSSQVVGCTEESAFLERRTEAEAEYRFSRLWRTGRCRLSLSIHRSTGQLELPLHRLDLALHSAVAWLA